MESIGEEKNRRLLALHPILHINELEAMALSGREDIREAASFLQAITKNTVIITLGKDGAYCLEKGGDSYRIPAIPVEHVVDTIGAGDSHAGAVIAGLTMGRSLREAVSAANRVAGAVVGVRGVSLPADFSPDTCQIFIDTP